MLTTPPTILFEDAPQNDHVAHLAIGAFDGIHIGHDAIMHTAMEGAANSEDPHQAGVLTFEPHPLAVISPERAPGRLTTLGQRRRILEKLGLADILLVEFCDSLRLLTPEQFVARLADIYPELRVVYVGPNWSFGHNREGNAERMHELGAPHGFDVMQIDPVMLDGEAVSSTRVRQAILDGDLEFAARMLGRPYELEGDVIPGDRRGRLLGFPTANVEITQLLPPHGVYACRVRLPGSEADYWAMANIGTRPTFAAGDVRFEAHILDYDGDLYGQRIALHSLEKIRDEQEFAGPDELKAQLEKDREAVEALRSSAGN